MAGPAAVRPRKALSSGRLTGAAKLTNGRKQFGVRKGCHSDVESGYSLYSTDSDDQVDTIHNGLDRCAALLKNILQNEARGKETNHKQPGKTTSTKMTSKPLLTKGNTSKKKGLKKNITPAHVRKEIVPISNRKLASSTTPSTEKELPSTGQNQMVQPIHVPCSQHSPVMHPKLCEHVQTQMSLITGQTPQNSNEIPTLTPLPTSNNGCQNVTPFNYRLPTSTSALSLQHSANPLSTQTNVPVDGDNERVPEVGGPVVCPVVSAASTAVQIQSATALPGVIPCTASGAPGRSTVSAFIPSSSGREVTPNHEQQIKEADLIRCIQAHLALLQSHEAMNGRTEQKHHHHCPAEHKASSNNKEETSEEHSEDTVSEEDELNVLDTAPVRDTNSKTSFLKKVLKSRKESSEETAHKVKTVQYLLGELRALIADQDDSEMLRLMSEIEDCISLLPAVVGSTNIQADIALALQPLRSENAQLRRRLRILNQQLGERERSEKASGQSCNYELVSLQSLNMMLQGQLKESLKGLESLQAKNEELLKIIESQKLENKRLAKAIQDKEEELLENKQHYDIQSTKLKMEVEEALANVKNLQFKLEASEKENKILGITLRQRDAEVNRLRELTRTLQGSMAKLLSDLTVDNIRPKREKGLSKSLLEDHEKQMQPDPFPGSTSVMTYLKKLEMDHVLPDTELHFSSKCGELEIQNLAYEKLAAEGNKINSTFSEKGTSTPRILRTSLKQDAETIRDSVTLLDDQSKLDETVYIPLTSSASKKQLPISERTGVLSQSRGACKMLDYHCELSDSVQQNGCEITKDPTILGKLSAGYSVKTTMENTLEVTGDKVKPEGDKVQMKPKGPPRAAAKDFTGKPDQSQPGTYPRVPMLFPKEASQKKGSGIADFSSILFDDISGKSEWSASSFSTFTSRDEEDFKNSLAALDANIARLQRTLQNSVMKQ
ncbi:PREDICTED: coiled-coil domain-containing protein 14-like isoform X1 [Calidris pugnax]|uniref:coiled-coil domain-containing protein 14-like isoform X1 n=1 Tax=Calidris pugnax TaxID=198806 RepID=UPI00071E5B6F|nr:PREDICTED: coiled-coil domain-containing protein 14-like isoform X1 [Calidris pugnax]